MLPVILSEAAASLREAATESKHPYFLFSRDRWLEERTVLVPKQERPAAFRFQGSFDSASPFVNEWANSAQDDNFLC